MEAQLSSILGELDSLASVMQSTDLLHVVTLLTAWTKIHRVQHLDGLIELF